MSEKQIRQFGSQPVTIDIERHDLTKYSERISNPSETKRECDEKKICSVDLEKVTPRKYTLIQSKQIKKYLKMEKKTDLFW